MNAPFKLRPHTSVSYDELHEILKDTDGSDTCGDTFLKTSAHAVHLNWYGPYETRESASRGAVDRGIDKGLFLVTQKSAWGKDRKAAFIGGSEVQFPKNVRDENLPFTIKNNHRFWIGNFEKPTQSTLPGKLSSDLKAVRAVLIRCFRPNHNAYFEENYSNDRVVVRNHWHNTDDEPFSSRGRVFADLVIYVDDKKQRAFVVYLDDKARFSDRGKKIDGVTNLFTKQPKKDWVDRVASRLATYLISAVIGVLLFAAYGSAPIDNGGAPQKPPLESGELTKELQKFIKEISIRDAQLRQTKHRQTEMTNRIEIKNERLKILEGQLLLCNECPSCPSSHTSSFAYASDYVCLHTDKSSSQK